MITDVKKLYRYLGITYNEKTDDFANRSIVQPKSEDALRVILCAPEPYHDFLVFPNSGNVHSDIWFLTHVNQMEFYNNAADALRTLQSRLTRQGRECPYIGKSDDEIIDFIKSKHIQSMSELESWINYLSASSGKVVDPDVDKAVVEDVPDKEVPPSSDDTK